MMMLKQSLSTFRRVGLYNNIATKYSTATSSRCLSSNVKYFSTSSKKEVDQHEEIDENALFEYDKPVDYAFLSKQFGVELNRDVFKKSSQGIQSYDIDNMSKAMKQLETLMRTEEGKKYLNILIADIKSSFGLESEEDMAKNLVQLDKEFTLRAGEPIQKLVERCQGKEVEHLSPKDREIYNDYVEQHPYIRYSRQLRFIMDLVDLVEVYNQSDSNTFEKAIQERFQVDTTRNDEEVDYLAQSEDNHDDLALARSTKLESMQQEVISMIKNDTLMHYLDRLFENASTQIFPTTSSQLSEAESTRRMEVAKEARLRLAQEAMEEEEDSERPFHLEDKNAARTDNEEMALNSLIPELDLLQPPEKQQQAKDPRDFLKYYRLYPKKIRNWIDYSHTPLGFFTELGVWYNFPAWYAKMYPAVKPEQLVTESASSTKEVELPEDLRGYYRFGVTKEEAEVLHPKLRDFLTFKHATQGEINQHRKKLCVQKYGNDHADTGSPSVQIAIFTEKLNYLETHIARNNKDNLAKRRYMLIQSQRKSMIDYLKRTNVEEYFKITKDLRIKNTML